MKKIFTITGSEDGVIGVASNKKRAYEKAIKYLTGPESSQAGETIDRTYNKLCSRFKEYSVATLQTKESPHGMSVDIEMFFLNV